MLEKGVAALGDAPVDSVTQQESEETKVPDLETMLSAVDDAAESAGNDAGFAQDPAAESNSGTAPEMGAETSAVEQNNKSEADAEMEQLLNEVEQNIQEPAYMDAAPTAAQDDFAASEAASTDTAVITAGMSITGDITSSGNMDLIGSITGNIEILGKLNVTGSISGNSAAAEIYAESAQINGEVKSKGSVKIGQSSVVIGNIFATSAVIAGAVKGDIDVHGPVILDTSAIVMGNIKSKSVQINNGAVIEGMCSQCYADVSPTSFFNDVKKNRGNSKDK
ncbi:MAG: polymer-forming cytoskeletal protein [Lachnospiraceae bacterium]|nr:polymer-forming cytoskeletal protein [Lachnospiraceae bacterium]